MKKLLVTYLFIFIIPHEGFAQWNTVYTDSNYYLTATWFLNTDTGFAVTGQFNSNGLILKTVNGGSSWSIVNSGIAVDLEDITFINNNIGFAVGSTIIGSFYYGIILKTIDGGNTWTTLWTGNNNNPTFYSLNSIQFLNQNVGYACVGQVDNRIIKTTDGGNTWNALTLNNSENYRKVFFINQDTGYVVSNNTYIQKTLNGGNSWTTLTYSTASAHDVFFISADTGFLACGNGYINKTVDGGNSWSSSTPGGTDDLYVVRFVNSTIGYIFFNSGHIYKTNDGGINWMQQQSSTSNRIQGSYFFDLCNGYAVGTGGTVIKTTNGGISIPNILLIGNDTLQCVIQGDNYIWLLNDSVIPITSQMFHVVDSGIYKVIVMADGCVSDTSLGYNYINTSIQENTPSILFIIFYPNPLTSSSTLQLNTQVTNAEVVIYNVLGKEVMRRKMDGDRMEIERGSLESGVYFVRVRSDERQWVEKLVVE